MATVSEILRRAIERSEQSQYLIAKETGVSKSVLSRFMSGGQLHTDNLDKIADHLGLTLKPKSKGK